MHYTYVLSSEKDGRFYIGTAADLRFETTSWNGTSTTPGHNPAGLPSC